MLNITYILELNSKDFLEKWILPNDYDEALT